MFPPPDLRILRAELDTADAMMALVKFSRDAHVIREYKQVAVRSYRTATDLMAQIALTAAQETELRARLGTIRRWFEAEGLLA